MVVMSRISVLVPVIFVLCLCFVSQPTNCSVLNETSYLGKGTSIFHHKLHEVANVISKVHQHLSGGRVFSKEKQLKLDDKFINLTALPYDYEGTMNSVQIIVNRGYPVASYSVTTEDGYILEVHRIPGKKGQTSDLGTGKPVFLQHGLLCSSADWLISPSDRSLAFILADRGYDVWLGNARGNIYSRKHKTLNQNKDAYWNFSWDEMGKFDIPAVLDFILSKTKRDKLIYIGHSMGCSMLFVAISTFPQLASKIEMMFAFAPATSLARATSPVIRTAGPFIKHLEFILKLLRTRAFLSQESSLVYTQRQFCSKNVAWASLCRNLLFLIVGDDTHNLDVEMLPVINGNAPAGTSVRTIAQFVMNHNSGATFIPYNFGLLGNYLRYGKFRPPPYDLSKVTIPVYLFYGQNDRLVVPEDVRWLADRLPNVKESIMVDDKSYNHASFLWGKNNNRLVYDRVISLLPSPAYHKILSPQALEEDPKGKENKFFISMAVRTRLACWNESSTALADLAIQNLKTVAKAHLSQAVMPFDAIRTNEQRRGQLDRKLSYPWFSERRLSRTTNSLFDKVTPHLEMGQKRDKTPVPEDPEARMTSIEIITGRGYPAETYSVVTEDGYILELHRIPRGKGHAADSRAHGKPILLQHGFLGSSADWLISPTDRNLAFQLADLGYDIWISNARGNTYSRKHQRLDPSEEAFWNFSWDEMGRYDIPAVIHFILARNGRPEMKLSYIGYSMGASMFFVAMIAHPELNSKIEVMIALGPASSLANIQSPVIRAIAPFVKHIEFLFRIARVRNFMFNDMPFNRVRAMFCRKNYLRAAMCRNVLFLLVGHDNGHFDLNLLPVIDGHLPAGTSVRTLSHFVMNHLSDKLFEGENFSPYDYGLLGNIRRYGTPRRPPYDLSKVTVPVYLFYGASDYLSTSKDVTWLSQRLPNVKELIKVDDTHYNHFDFLWAKDNNRLIYNKMFSILPPPTFLFALIVCLVKTNVGLPSLGSSKTFIWTPRFIASPYCLYNNRLSVKMRALGVIFVVLGLANASALLGNKGRHHSSRGDEEIYMTTAQIIVNRGYPVELHYIETSDGYLLEAQRIPYGKNSGPAPNKPVVFLQHGLLSSSADWIIGHTESYLLADAGYDVWLGAVRGNTYGRNHTTLSPDNDSSFWDFSFDQIGQYDVPANLRYILAYTNQATLSYVGHSQGTLTFYIAMETNPDLNEKVIANLLGIDEFLPSSDFFDLMGQEECQVNSTSIIVCESILFLICGPDVSELDPALISLIVSHTPAGTSVQNLLHYAQEYNYAYYAHYDFGTLGNINNYGQETPPLYNAGKVTAPMITFWGDNDWLADPVDVAWAESQFPNLRESVHIAHFNHLDFLWAIHVKELVNDVILANMPIKPTQP
ncbi:Lipase-like protein [Daphnia magna]|uniref:Lipase-like protein n=2 Tax=Daphnia magna TaxID=35525 RepID=A0A162SES9_9CRUS|nr:Lipase-like protein [Daphnia magna]